jgi:hypothetical protein
MPFLTYTIENKISESLNINNKNSIDRFINRIEDLNYKKRAIFVAESKDILDKLSKKFLDLSKKINTGEDHIIRDTIFKLTQILNDSYLCDISKNNENVKIDFKKNLNNEIDKKLFYKFNKDVFDPSNFDKSVKVFKEDFLEKIKTFIISNNSKENYVISNNIKEKKINNICIFHKELSNYLLPWKFENGEKKILIDQKLEESLKDPLIQKKPKQYRSYYKENVAKIAGGTKLLHNWWKALPDDFRPDKFIILTDIPFSNYSKTHMLNHKIKEIFQSYLFDDVSQNKFKAKIDFLDKNDVPKSQWWKHKRHFVFGKGLSLVIWSEFGVEFVDERNDLKLNGKNQFIIDNNKENEHRREISGVIQNL